MDTLTFFAVIALAIAAWRLSRRARRSDAQWRELTARLAALEEKVCGLSGPLQAAAPPTRAEPSPSVSVPAAAEPSTPLTSPAPPAPEVSARPLAPAASVPGPFAPPPQSPSARTGTTPLPPARHVEAQGLPRWAVTNSSQPARVPSAGEPSPATRGQGWNAFEEMLGGNLFTKLGVVLVVIGVTFWVATGWHKFSPGLKITIGYSVSALLLVPGIFFERRERWRTLARAGIGGGWALLYFVTYAMRHVAGSLVIHSEALDLVLMLIVAAAMAAHTLKYRSQVVTGLAFLLGFTTVAISHVTVYSLVASAILAIGLVLIVQRMHWFELEVFGILATFLNHLYWVMPIVERVGAHHAFPEYGMSVAMLVFYWLLFSASYVVRGIRKAREEQVSTLAALLNVGFFLGIMGYQAVYPAHRFAFFLVVGTVELALGQLPVTRRRRAAFAVLTTVGAVLLATAFPYKYSGSDLSVVWLADAEAFFLVGVFLREIVFRRLGLAAALLASVQMLWAHVWPLMTARWETNSPRPEFALAMLFALAAAIFYVNAHWVARRWRDLVTTNFEARSLVFLSYGAGVLALVAAWLAWPGSWTAVAWCALALGLAMGGGLLNTRELSRQAHLVAAVAVLATLATNFDAPGTIGPLSLRLVTVSAVIILLYACAWWARQAPVGGAGAIAAAHAWTAMLLAMLLAWHELAPVNVVVAWMLIGLASVEAGMIWRSPTLRLQGYAALAACFVRIFFVNLIAAGQPGTISPRLYTILPLVLAYYYVYWRLRDAPGDAFSMERRFQLPVWQCFFGTAALAALVKFEFDPVWVATAWAGVALILLTVAVVAQRGIFLTQGLLMGVVVLFRALTFNLFEENYAGTGQLGLRWVTVGTAAALLFACLALAYRLRAAEEIQKAGEQWTSLWVSAYRRPEQFFFFSPALLVLLLAAVELHGGRITLAWGLEGVAIFLFALFVKERSFRLAGVSLLLLSVGKITFMDVWTLHGNDRAVTLTGLGIALILVSWLYAKHREAIHRYL